MASVTRRTIRSSTFGQTPREGREIGCKPVARLCDLPAEWSRQRQMLGLAALYSASEPRLCQRRPGGVQLGWELSIRGAVAVDCEPDRNRI